MKKISIENVDLKTAVKPKNFDIAYPVKLKDLNNGEFFITTLKSNTVYTKAEYDKSERKYYCENYNDYNNGKYFDGNKIVYFGFTY